MIPKLVHYCWFGYATKNYLVQKCINSFNKLDVKICEWTEKNIDLNHPFVAQAYKIKAWAFVSDYIRLKALYEYGGVYLDTDIEIKKTFDDKFWKADLILGFMYDDLVSTAVIMATPHHPFIKILLDCYDTMKLNIEEANNIMITEQLLNVYPKFLLNGKYQEFYEKCYIYPKYYFEEPILIWGNGGYCVHHFMGSWQNRNNSLKTKLRPVIKYILFNIFYQ